MIELFETSGRRVPLGKKLGTGGEGAVYDAPFFGPDFVAKVYHRFLSSNRQAKLLAMVEGGTETLRKVAAWPVATLHLKPHGAICGFVMPKVVGYEPIHHLYGPGHRKQRFPNADWSFLVNAARNVSSAFDTIHAHHHVIGDVNQNNVVVARNSIVKLIDCDSFQITTAHSHYLCEVGVTHFTPPELQGHSFHGVHRTREHDNFGLAVLIFHLLLMGRHPYCGVYSGSGEMPIEKAIQEFRFAFGNSASIKKMAPPPNSVSLEILPPAIISLFERAFTVEGVQTQRRPTARDWLIALETLKSQLKTCDRTPIHQYFDCLPVCPWCTLEMRSNLFFFNLSPSLHLSSSGQAKGNFDIHQIWEEISAVPSPGPPPSVHLVRTSPAPLPRELSGPLGIFRGRKYREEKKRREVALENAKAVFNSCLARWKEEGGDSAFNEKFRELFYLRLEYEQLLQSNHIESSKPKKSGRRIAQLLKNFLRGKPPKSLATQKVSTYPKRKDSIQQEGSDFSDQRREYLESALREGATQLRQIHEKAVFSRQAMHSILASAAQTLAQAEADARLTRK